MPRPNNNIHHLSKSDVPKAAHSTQDCLYIHLRGLWSLLDADTVPAHPPASAINRFNERFASADEVRTMLNNIPEPSLASEAEAKRRRLRSEANTTTGYSQIKAKISQITDPTWERAFLSVSQMGLSAWCPNILEGTPDDLYNMAHEIVALETFKNSANALAFTWFKVNLDYIKPAHALLLQRMYRNFVYHYMFNKARQEMKNPGSVKKGNEQSLMYARRKALTKHCLNYLKADGWSPRVRALAGQRRATSDDEYDSDTDTYVVKTIPARDALVSFFWITIDPRRFVAAAAKGRHYKKERKRERPTPPKLSDFERLPTKVPIDWFDPDFFNALPMKTRYKYRNNGIAFPLPIHCKSDEAIMVWKGMGEAEFMRVFGNEVLALYKIPTAADMAAWVNAEDGRAYEDDFSQSDESD